MLTAPMEALLIDDVIPHVDTTFRTVASGVEVRWESTESRKNCVQFTIGLFL